jgi:hypothetical protein
MKFRSPVCRTAGSIFCPNVKDSAQKLIFAIRWADMGEFPKGLHRKNGITFAIDDRAFQSKIDRWIGKTADEISHRRRIKRFALFFRQSGKLHGSSVMIFPYPDNNVTAFCIGKGKTMPDKLCTTAS